jgi:hypothetical protein
MTLATDEFIRRFLIHVLPKGFHRIRHYGLLATGNRAENIAHAHQLLAVPPTAREPETPKAAIDEPRVLPPPCPCCGARMIVIETFGRGCQPKHRPTPPPAAIRIDTSWCSHLRSTNVATLGIPASSPPAPPKLASVHCIQQPSRHQSCRAARSSLAHTDVADLASPQADRGNRFNPTSASPNSRQNPHSARGTAATNLPRFRALALFGRRPPERVVRPSSRRPKTCTVQDSCAAKNRRLDGTRTPAR